MTARERFLATISFEPSVRPLMWECGFWRETIDLWRTQGLPGSDASGADARSGERLPGGHGYARDVCEYFDFDEYYAFIPIQTRNLVPGFDEEVLEDHGSWTLRRNRNGAVEKVGKDNPGVRAIVRGAVETPADWERIKSEHMKPVLEDRVTGCLDHIIERVRTGTQPIRGIQCEPWLNLGELFGLDKLLYLMAAEPAFIKAVLNDLTEFFLSLTDQLLSRIVPDICWVGGDFCFKTGPMMSPAMFREFLFPSFRSIAGLYRDYGVPAVIMHTDGDCRSLIPQFIEAGVTGAHPFEVTNGQNIAEVREAFPSFHIFGGIDKKAVAAGRDLIDAELAAKLPGMLGRGGFIPYIDHSVPPTVPWPHFVYYRQQLARMVGR